MRRNTGKGNYLGDKIQQQNKNKTKPNQNKNKNSNQ